MNKQQTLEILMLLSALESWSFSIGKSLPYYLQDNLISVTETLTNHLLGDSNEQA